ncbi:hypothetical protein H6P81_015168 [Aristolochia fimbriata]|uniref:Uncharacterized protein n=1 Tax=Aristolochia fimbriata TaxID=158543 RepID=A0AAV7E4R1_ARIFI|nr:hypothetical protein H6P81_015168 [Aristolochia fimbriata]
METMGSLHQHLYAKPKTFSNATRSVIPVTTRVSLHATVPSSSWVVKCSAALKPEGQDEKEGGRKPKGFSSTDFGAPLLMKSYFPLEPVLGDVLGPAEKINQVLSGYKDKLEKLKTIESTLEVQIRGDGGEHAYLEKLKLVEQLIYQGKFEFAKQFCENYILPEASPRDHRPRFYLVVAQVMLMLDLAEKTSEHWKEIVDSYAMFQVPITGPNEDAGPRPSPNEDVGPMPSPKEEAGPIPSPNEDAGPMPSPVEDGGGDRQRLFVDLMRIFKEAISGEGGSNADLKIFCPFREA